MDNLPTLSSTVTSYHNQTVTIATMSSFGAFTKPRMAKCSLFIGGYSQARFFSAGAQNCKTMTNPCLQSDRQLRQDLPGPLLFHSILFHFVTILKRKTAGILANMPSLAPAKGRNVSHGALNHNDQRNREYTVPLQSLPHSCSSANFRLSVRADE